MKTITEYFKGIALEMKHVVWPSRNQTALLTLIVVLVSFAIGYYFGLLDMIFAQLLDLIL